jgi:hypothetical protein
VLTDEQESTRKAFAEWWINDAWPAVHMGVQYPDFDGADAAALLKLLRTPHVHWDLQTAKDVAQVYLRQPEVYGAVGHKLREIGHRLGHYLDLYERAKKGWLRNGKRKPTAADRGEYHRPLPSGVRSLDDVELPDDAHAAARAD